MSFLRELAAAPYRFDFHQTLRRFENLFRESPRWGSAALPSLEPIRLGQDPSLAFGAAMLNGFRSPEGDRPGRLAVAFFGLFGPHGPLPLHLTEYARDRIRHSGDRTFAGFVDIFQHRMLVLFHRAWSAAQPTASLDRADADRFQAYVAAVFGHDFAAHGEGSAQRWAKLQYAAHFANPSRHPSGLEALLSHHLGVPAVIEEFVGCWLTLPESARFALGVSAEVSTLGVTTVLGRRVFRCDQKFRIVLGPLTRAEFDRLLPSGSTLPRLRDLVRAYVCDELDWDIRLVLDENENDQARLSRDSRLAWNARLGARKPGKNESLVVHPATGRTERSVA
ncbi:MAG TPA: type VI secretion system baseplate subunit TssG [Polyangiaceae bacterium]|nr:type VI secretion system baseplate subunit TssG [Polyangiaceae bacterium]